MFTDRVCIEFIAGKGGNGVVAWRREKYIPKGGPSGGNGGRGGSVILQADAQLFSLEALSHVKLLKAERGGDGGPSLRQGKQGKNLVIKVPCGTLVKDADTGDILHDFTSDKEEFLLCKGGRGGRGNDSFKSPTNRAPNFCTMGTLGETIEAELELKLIADIGLVGFPNAGKSTLFQSLTQVEAKIGAYPFTTLRPSIGFIEDPDHKRIFIADIPGIIEDAHKDRGLGLDFLRHIERTKYLIFVLDTSGIDGRDPSSDFRTLLNELEAYDPELLEKPFLVVLNKIDTETAVEHLDTFFKEFGQLEAPVFRLSAMTGEGVPPLLQFLSQLTDNIVSS